MNNLKYANADLLTLRQFETFVSVDRARRQRICKEYNIDTIDIGLDTRQPRLVKQQVINMLNKSIIDAYKQPGKPRGWNDLQLISFQQLKKKFNISPVKIKLYAARHKIRILNISGSPRVPLSDLKLLLSKRVEVTP